MLTTGTIATDPLPTFTWTGIDGVEQYEISVSLDSQFGQTYRSIVTGTSVQLERPLIDGPNEIRVRPWQSATVVGAWSDSATVTLASSGALTTEPNPLSTLDATPLLTWAAVEEAAGYEVIIHNDEESYYGRDILTSSWTPPTNLATGNWTLAVRVRERNGNFGSWSGTGIVIGDVRTRFTAPGFFASATPTFEWRVVDGADTYVLHVEDDAGNVVIREDSLTTTTHIVVTPLDAGTYRYWVRAINSAESIIGPWSYPSTTRVS